MSHGYVFKILFNLSSIYILDKIIKITYNIDRWIEIPKTKKEIKAINLEEKEKEIASIIERYKKYNKAIFVVRKKSSEAFEAYIKALEEGTVQEAKDKEGIWKDLEKTVSSLKEQRKNLVNESRWKYPELKNLSKD